MEHLVLVSALTNGANPLQTATYNYDRSTITRSFNTLAATVTLWDELKLREKVAFDYTSSIESVWWDPRSNDGRSSNGVFQRYNRTLETFSGETQLTYIKTFAQKHNLDALLGLKLRACRLVGIYSWFSVSWL
ncbi:hypothetical protein NXV23_00010 [Bacteroides fragilis]|nr:hypothetical protein [Bacteroides fragilis]